MMEDWRNPWYSELKDLMTTWDELTNGEEAHGPFVKLYGGFNCVDEYGERSVAASWDELKIEAAVRQVCESKGLSYQIKSRGGAFSAEVSGHTYDSKSSAVAILRSYLTYLENL